MHTIYDACKYDVSSLWNIKQSKNLIFLCLLCIVRQDLYKFKNKIYIFSKKINGKKLTGSANMQNLLT